jgi:Prolyl oligopeptidase, N-terminal beta-propeller domain
MIGTRGLEYPEARKLDLTEEIFRHEVSDPYRWMEDAGSAERADWLRAQAGLFSAERALHRAGRDVRLFAFAGFARWRVSRPQQRADSSDDPGEPAP